MDNYFDTDVAQDYDSIHGGTDPELLKATVSRLIELADGGSALEFAVGTGRIALPMIAEGCKVVGIELSEAMVAELRAKEVGTAMPVKIGDMTTAQISGDFSLVFLVFNTIDNLLTQDAQVACFQNAADHLAPGGRFVIETLVPPLQKLPHGETRLAFAAAPDHIGTDVFDVVTQNYTSHHMWMHEGTHQHLTVPFRYAWPAEFDLMARLAGMTLEHRWADWDKSSFTNTSKSHISVWRKDVVAT